jgi:hypothetical protein
MIDLNFTEENINRFIVSNKVTIDKLFQYSKIDLKVIKRELLRHNRDYLAVREVYSKEEIAVIYNKMYDDYRGAYIGRRQDALRTIDSNFYINCGHHLQRMLEAYLLMKFANLVVESQDLKLTQPTINDIELKPKFTNAEDVNGILKDYFDEPQQGVLEQLLNSGDNTSEKLIFKGQQNQLSDVFKKLFENNLVTGFNKTQLIEWIVSNFCYRKNEKVIDFKFDSVEKVISREDSQYKCANPIVTIKEGKLTKLTKKEYHGSGREKRS